ncbi:uncharacterized protein LOC120788792 isoform X2 [Xiphias gladius]|uniref:uncharacterized protein LOC120788792 isoform X2 n=1 Tax=Xiphias gladius TaxID=8245 RepID=UPI001A99E4E6|nr:uncharacterized protein LOC120788792 isoform X2 [Xiphias gladius]
MVEFKWIKMSFFLMALPFTVNGQSSHMTVRGGGEVTLPCQSVRDDQVKCNGTAWLFDESQMSIILFEYGKIRDEAKSKSDRLSVTENCSLVIKKVTVQDVGRYICRQFDQLQQRYEDALVYLSVITMTEHKNDSMVTLNCSVSTRGRCGHTVKWLYQGQDVDKDHKELRTSRSGCWATVSFKTSHFIYSSNNYESLKCKVTDENTGEEQLFPFSPEKPGTDSSAATKPTTTPEFPSGTNTTASTVVEDFPDWAKIIIVAVGLVALLLIFVALIRWKRNEGNKTRMDDKTAVPDDGVSYASISYARETDREAQIWSGDDAVTYSSVKAPSSSAGASADPSDLYAAVNKSNI